MARIYIGRSTGIGSFERHVVLKMILPERANDVTSVQMFLDEARLAASLNHQNVAQVFEVGEDGGIHFLAMEYVHGQDLRALLAKAGSTGTRVPLELALTVVAGAAAGLDHAHERRTSDGTPMGIVHRDVSPSNIMIGYDGSVKLLDFGIAKATMRSVETQSGIIKGKFAYMAPEQCRGRDVDRRSDVFSLGIILYEVTTQHRCFRADSDFDTMHRIVTGDIVRPTRLVQGYPQALEAIVMKALSVDANHRYASAGLFLEAVEAFAVGARMSLSTMSLGRFMRDMFGDQQEPWLTSNRTSQPLAPREQTISNTNGTGRRAGEAADAAPSERAGSSPPVRVGSAPPVREGSAPSVRTGSASRMRHEDAPLHLPPTQQFDVPARSNDSRPSGGGVPAYTSPDPRASAPHLPAPPERSSPSGVRDARLSSLLSPQIAAHSSSALPIASQPFTSHPGSGSGPAHGALPLAAQMIAPNRQGYANAPSVSHSELPYPRYAQAAHDPNLELGPNNRLLYMGLGVVLVGIIVLLAIAIADSSDELPPPPPRPATTFGAIDPASPPLLAVVGTGSAAVVTPEPVKPEPVRAEPAGAGSQAVRDESISLRILSTPPGADVLLAGKPIGTTPLETKIKRGTGAAMLTVHRAKFVDVTMPVDLTADVTKEVALVAVASEPVPPPVRPAPPPVRPPVRQVRPPPRDNRPRPPAAQKCQPPGQFNPFDTTCNGEPCKPCK
jgi:serine/threonine-protein kinase